MNSLHLTSPVSIPVSDVTCVYSLYLTSVRQFVAPLRAVLPFPQCPSLRILKTSCALPACLLRVRASRVFRDIRDVPFRDRSAGTFEEIAALHLKDRNNLSISRMQPKCKRRMKKETSIPQTEISLVVSRGT